MALSNNKNALLVPVSLNEINLSNICAFIFQTFCFHGKTRDTLQNVLHANNWNEQPNEVICYVSGHWKISHKESLPNCMMRSNLWGAHVFIPRNLRGLAQGFEHLH